MVPHTVPAELVDAVGPLLGSLHGGVGVTDEGIELLAMTRPHRHAHASAHMHRSSLNEEGFPKTSQQNLGESPRLDVAGHARGEDNELVASETRDGGTWRSGFNEATRDHGEKLVANSPPEVVVDGLESIQTNAQHGRVDTAGRTPLARAFVE